MYSVHTIVCAHVYMCEHNCMCACVHVCVVCAGDLRIAIHPCNFVHLIGNGSEFTMKCFCELQS